MTPEEEHAIRKFNASLTEPVRVGRVENGSRQDAAFAAFCETLRRLAPNVHVHARDADTVEGPALLVGARLCYRAIPGGPELEPFLSLLAAESGAANMAPAPDIGHLLDGIRDPAHLKIYIAPQCPFCPTAVKETGAMALACPRLHLTVVDSVMFAEAAEADGIRSVPTILLEDQFRWTGSVEIREVARTILNRDPLAIGAASLRNMLENGEADRVARTMIAGGRINPALVQLLIHERWPVRLGAMVVMETLAAEDAALAARVVGPLWERFDGLSDPVKGDVLYVIGQTGCGQAVAKLESVAAGPFDPVVKEAAAEALEAIADGKKPDRSSR